MKPAMRASKLTRSMTVRAPSCTSRTRSFTTVARRCVVKTSMSCEMTIAMMATATISSIRLNPSARRNIRDSP